MASTIKIKRSSVAGKAPTTSDLSIGELALNTKDQKLYSSNGSAIFEIGSSSGVAGSNVVVSRAKIETLQTNNFVITNVTPFTGDVYEIVSANVVVTTSKIENLQTNNFVVTSVSNFNGNVYSVSLPHYISNTIFYSALANTNSYISTKINTSTFNSALANTNAYIATKAPIDSASFTGNTSFDTSTLFVDGTNNRVGIGTSSPSTELEVNGVLTASGLTYPSSDGTNGQLLTTNGSGTLSFTDKNVEIFEAKTSATSTVTHDLNTAAVFRHTSISANFTANFTNVDTTNDRTTSVALILVQGGTARMPTAVQIDGAAQTILWQGGSAPSGTANGTDVVSFTLIRSGSAWTVIGSATSYS